jgi:hypothetical protein
VNKTSAVIQMRPHDEGSDYGPDGVADPCADLAIAWLVRQHPRHDGPKAPWLKIKKCDRSVSKWEKELAVSASIEIAKDTLISGGVIFAVGALTGFLAQKIKIPAEVALMSICPSASGPINMPTIKDTATSHAIGNEGGSSS